MCAGAPCCTLLVVARVYMCAGLCWARWLGALVCAGLRGRLNLQLITAGVIPAFSVLAEAVVGMVKSREYARRKMVVRTPVAVRILGGLFGGGVRGGCCRGFVVGRR